MKELLKALLQKLLLRRLFWTGSKDAVYITFDDGPHPINTPNILNHLKKLNKNATFFVVGKEVEQFPELTKFIQDSGHRLAYHSYFHKEPNKQSFSEFRDDLQKAKELEEKYDISFNRIYRPPYGQLSVIKTVYLLITGWKIAMWSIDSEDSFVQADESIKIVKNAIKSGSIILFHDDYAKTSESMPEFLDAIKNYPCSVIK